MHSVLLPSSKAPSKETSDVAVEPTAAAAKEAGEVLRGHSHSGGAGRLREAAQQTRGSRMSARSTAPPCSCVNAPASSSSAASAAAADWRGIGATRQGGEWTCAREGSL